MRTSGLLSRDESASSDATTNSPAVSQSQSDKKGASADSKGAVTKDNKSEESNQSGLRNAEDVARLVWGFFGAAGGMVEEMMGAEDEVKLLRLRTRRNELVIVPGMSQVWCSGAVLRQGAHCPCATKLTLLCRLEVSSSSCT